MKKGNKSILELKTHIKTSIQKKEIKIVKGKKNRWDKQKTNSKMVNLKLTKLTITLNVNGLNTPIKRQILLEFKCKTQL